MAARLHRIEVERATVVVDDYGGETPTWATHATLFAEIKMGSSRERREAAQEAASQTATFIIAWSPLAEAISATDRIIYQGAQWDVQGPPAPSLEFRKNVEITAVKSA